MGEGHIKTVDVEPGFKFVLHHYTLKEDFHLKRKSPLEGSDLISIVFNINEIPLGLYFEGIMPLYINKLRR